MTSYHDLVGYDDIPEESWTRLLHAADQPAHPMRLFVMATLASDGTPDARLMVLRGADRGLANVWFHADRRSLKVDQIRRVPALCAVAYDGRDGVQIRIRGSASVHERDDVAKRHWSQVSAALRSCYASPDPPGVPLRHPDPRLMNAQEALQHGEEDVASTNFAVITVLVKSLEWLQVCDDQQRRALLHAATGWAAQPIAP